MTFRLFDTAPIAPPLHGTCGAGSVFISRYSSIACSGGGFSLSLRSGGGRVEPPAQNLTSPIREDWSRGAHDPCPLPPPPPKGGASSTSRAEAAPPDCGEGRRTARGDEKGGGGGGAEKAQAHKRTAAHETTRQRALRVALHCTKSAVLYHASDEGHIFPARRPTSPGCASRAGKISLVIALAIIQNGDFVKARGPVRARTARADQCRQGCFCGLLVRE